MGLKVYHPVEPEFKESVDPEVYDEQIGMMEMVLDVDAIIEEVKINERRIYKILNISLNIIPI